MMLLQFNDQQPDVDKIYLYMKDPLNQSINYLLIEEKKYGLKSRGIN